MKPFLRGRVRAVPTTTGGKPKARLVRRLTAITSSAIALTAIAIAPAHASWYWATTGGSGANLRSCASTGCPISAASVPAWTGIRIVCQKVGQSVTGYYGTTNLWDYVVWEGGSGRPEGFAADANINTGYSYWIPGIQVCQ
ncbi:hypothetical protein [Streptomyces sp. SID13031]|uniref:hypothetical protein n=1 Tax=Streptomyces sp. SID13031 TaxID=2706046 RepID=UPI0013C96571|nr:hypothetical protein [Streptomyces sp. SID13031]NEA31948.1 hypothetical protein [Streptomyces sp. SID13031]